MKIKDEAVEAAIAAFHERREGHDQWAGPKSMRAALEAALPHLSQEPDFSRSIRETIKQESENGAACGWRSCTGCHETSEGAETGLYPYSTLFQCHVGAGCGECGGLGVIWEYWDTSALAEMSHEPAPRDNQADLTATDDDQMYLIRKGGAYYRPNAQGYTTVIAEAGRFTLDEAIRHSHPNGPDGWRDGISYYPAPTDTQEGPSEAGEVVAWRNWNQLHECYYLDEVPRGALKVHDEKNEPLVRLSALTACQQEVETLREGIKEIAELNQDIRGNWERYDAETSARILELEADLEIANDKVERLRKALEPFVRHLNEMKFDLDHEGNELPGEQTCGCVYLTLADFRRARAALGGHSNEA